MNNYSLFEKDKEGNITMLFAEFLNKNGWEVLACHPPGGHTSFSILDGRRSKGAYMPDIIAIQKKDIKNNIPIVILVESKPSYDKSDGDILKLMNISNGHASWIGFRLQNHLDREKWELHWQTKLQKIIVVGEIGFLNLNYIKNTDLIVIEINKEGKPTSNSVIGINAPAKKIFEEILKVHSSNK